MNGSEKFSTQRGLSHKLDFDAAAIKNQKTKNKKQVNPTNLSSEKILAELSKF